MAEDVSYCNGFEHSLVVGINRTKKYGDYTAERDALFADMTLDDMLTDIECERKRQDKRLWIVPRP